MKIIQNAQLKNKKVLLRVDFNVAIKRTTDNGQLTTKIEGDQRIRESIPTIEYILEQGVAKLTIISHLGKPEGKKDPAYSLWPVANRLAELLKIDIKFDKMADEYQISDQISLKENLRFNPGEEANDLDFAKILAKNQDIFIFDAFGTAHRAHASTSKVAELLPSFAGFLVQKEIENLDKILKNTKHPFTFILGGAKIADKLPTIKNMMSFADNFLIGGAVANTFLAARRHLLGKSLVDTDSLREANIIWQNLMDDSHKNLFLPRDLLLSKSLTKATDLIIVDVADLLEPKYQDYMVIDIGPKTIALYQSVIGQSEMIFWNGGMGVAEIPEFATGTKEVAKAIFESNLETVIGGGDTVAAVEKLMSSGKKTTNNIFLSTGGGATLEYLSGKVLPGLKSLM